MAGLFLFPTALGDQSSAERRSIKKTIFDMIRDKNESLFIQTVRSRPTYGYDQRKEFSRGSNKYGLCQLRSSFNGAYDALFYLGLSHVAE